MAADRPPRLSRAAVLALAAALIVLAGAGALGAHLLAEGSRPSVALHPPALFPDARLVAVTGPLQAAEDAADRDARRWIAQHPTATLAQFTAWAGTRIPAPPAGARQAAELRALHALPARTPAADRAAAWAEQAGAKAIWKLYAKQYGQLAPVPAAAAAKRLVKQTIKAATQAQVTLKDRFARPSPYITDPTLNALNQRRFARKFSYPSKHATVGVAAVTVLARLDPLRAPELRHMLDEILFSRLYARGHYPSDLVAGERLGRLIGDFELYAAHLPPA